MNYLGQICFIHRCYYYRNCACKKVSKISKDLFLTLIKNEPNIYKISRAIYLKPSTCTLGILFIYFL